MIFRDFGDLIEGMQLNEECLVNNWDTYKSVPNYAALYFYLYY